MKVIVGDIHACYNELEELLDKISPSSEDQIIALGDIVDRGPDNRKILDLFTKNPQFMTIKGNHERKHHLSHDRLCRAALSQQITKKELDKDYIKLVNYAKSLPLYLILDEAILVHGAIEPGVPLEDQKEVVLVSSMSGQRRVLDKYPRPWYELINPEKPVIFGHRGYDEPFIYQDKVYGIDTRCCRGNSLTAITLPDFKIYSVKAKKEYWRDNRIKNIRINRFERKGMDINKVYESIMQITEQLKAETKDIKEFAALVNQRNLPGILFQAYKGRLTKGNLRKMSPDKLKYFI